MGRGNIDQLLELTKRVADDPSVIETYKQAIAYREKEFEDWHNKTKIYDAFVDRRYDYNG